MPPLSPAVDASRRLPPPSAAGPGAVYGGMTGGGGAANVSQLLEEERFLMQRLDDVRTRLRHASSVVPSPHPSTKPSGAAAYQPWP